MINAKKKSSLGGFEPPTFRLTAERTNRLRHKDLLYSCFSVFILIKAVCKVWLITIQSSKNNSSWIPVQNQQTNSNLNKLVNNIHILFLVHDDPFVDSNQASSLLHYAELEWNVPTSYGWSDPCLGRTLSTISL